MKRTDRSRARGFTLIEILVAIIIISLLAGIVVFAGRGALHFFRSANDKNDLDNVAKALELYKQKYGEYPPDGTNIESARKYLLKRDKNLLLLKNKVGYGTIFSSDEEGNIVPRIQGDELVSMLGNIASKASLPELLELLKDDCLESGKFSTEQFLTLWLCGDGWFQWWFYNSVAEINLYNLYENVKGSGGLDIAKEPDLGESEFLELKPAFYKESEKGTAKPGANFSICQGIICSSRGYPVVYFRANKNVQTGETFYNEVEGWESHPYRHCEEHYGADSWFNPDSYQLILPGEDGDYTTHEDNVTNFCSAATMADEEFEGRHGEDGHGEEESEHGGE